MSDFAGIVVRQSLFQIFGEANIKLLGADKASQNVIEIHIIGLPSRSSY